ncbi:hypothetical protein C4569_03115 [Candidatus Parcubacteria bacterium]|nr:MAG: hypothetical protein C4569_03115 [Candidatus Parcubacteria bacterium]
MIDEQITYGVLGPKAKKYSIYFFIFGLIGAFGVRLVLIISHFSQFWGSLAWYVAMISYLIFYHHRYYVEFSRKKIIEKYDLLKKFKKEQLSDLEKNELLMILNSVYFSRSTYNFYILYVATVAALILEIIIDFIKYF